MNPVERAFPGLTGTDYRVTSEADTRYNCIAWAAGQSDRWWWPDALGEANWTVSAPRTESLEGFAAAYATLGYTPAADDTIEPRALLVAIFARDGKPTHAARQLPHGRWTSKLGSGKDIEHELLALAGTVLPSGRRVPPAKRHLTPSPPNPTTHPTIRGQISHTDMADDGPAAFY